MSDYSRTEAAERAGIGLDELRRMIDLGILHAVEGDRFTSGEVRKAGLIHSMMEAGLPIEGLAWVVTSGTFGLDFMDTPAYERFSMLSDITFAQMSERTGVPVELLMLIREATGGARPNPDVRLREGELDIVPYVAAYFQEGFAAGVERILRVQGDSLRKIAETEGEWWRSDVIIPALAAGKTGADLANTELSDKLAVLIEPALVANYRAHQVREWTRNIVEGFETVLAEAGLHGRVDRPPAMCFLDITGYTRLTDERGDEAAAALAVQLNRMVQRTSVQHGGRPVKWLGDGIMFYFPEPGLGVLAAPLTWPTGWSTPACRPLTWGYTPDRSCSRRAITTGRR
jgi:adenylate cyclase